MKSRLLYSLLLIIVFFNVSLAQDDTEEEANSAKTYTKEELQEEQKALKFEKHFMESIQQKSIENYTKALESLLKCQQIFPENLAMLFEMAKNYFYLKQYIEAHHYCDLALQREPINFWVLELKREIYIKERNYVEAIRVQKKLYAQKPLEAENLLRLYYYNKDIEAGQQLLLEIDKLNIYISSYSFYNSFFNKEINMATSKRQEVKINDDKNISELQKEFAKNNSFSVLKTLLEKERKEKEFKNLLKDSKTGLNLYPAQAIVYLYNGLALIEFGKHLEAIAILEMGIDYVFDAPSLSKQFYDAIISSCNATNNRAKANKYKQLVQKL